MIEFSIPGFYGKNGVNQALLSLMEQEPEKFHEDIKITSCYDSFPCVWNGGRFVEGFVMAEDIIRTLNNYNDKGISLRYTFTNPLIDEDMVKDYTGNSILDLTRFNQKEKTGININQEVLRDHIENKYGDKFYFLWSTTKDIKDIDEINELSKDSLVVPSYDINNDFDALAKLEHPENVELLCWEACVANCKFRKDHYKSIAKAQSLDLADSFMCPHNRERFDYYEVLGKQPHNITINVIREKYLPLGINKFKISGRRETDIHLVEHYVNFFVKPEFKEEIRLKLLKSIILKTVTDKN